MWHCRLTRPQSPEKRGLNSPAAGGWPADTRPTRDKRRVRPCQPRSGGLASFVLVLDHRFHSRAGSAGAPAEQHLPCRRTYQSWSVPVEHPVHLPAHFGTRIFDVGPLSASGRGVSRMISLHPCRLAQGHGASIIVSDTSSTGGQRRRAIPALFVHPRRHVGDAGAGRVRRSEAAQRLRLLRRPGADPARGTGANLPLPAVLAAAEDCRTGRRDEPAVPGGAGCAARHEGVGAALAGGVAIGRKPHASGVGE